MRAGAQPAPPPPLEEVEPPPVHIPEFREPGRFVIGFNVGIVVIDAVCEGCAAIGGLSTDIYSGVHVTPRLSLVGDLWAANHLLPTDGENKGLASHVLGTAAAQFWITPELFVRAGIGAAGFVVLAEQGDSVDFGPGAALTLGGEPGHKPRSGIDVAMRLGASWLRISDPSGASEKALFYNIAFVVGWHWN